MKTRDEINSIANDLERLALKIEADKDLTDDESRRLINLIGDAESQVRQAFAYYSRIVK